MYTSTDVSTISQSTWRKVQSLGLVQRHTASVHIHGCFYHLTQSTWRKDQSLGLVQRHTASVHIHGCFYHLSQSTWRKVQSLGLVQRHTASVHIHGCFYHLTVYMEEGPESWFSTTSYRQCTHPRMFLPSHSLHGGRSRVLV